MKNLSKKLAQWPATVSIALLASTTAMPAMSAPSYTFQSVASPGDPAFTQLLGINNNKVIAGYFGDGATVPNNGFTLVLPNTFTSENVLNAAQTQVIAISNTKTNHVFKTVGFFVDAAGKTHGFGQAIQGAVNTIDAPGTQFNQLLGVNDLGEVAGYSSNVFAGDSKQRAFVRGPAGVTYVPFSTPPVNSQATSINDTDIVGGFYETATSTFGFLWDMRNNAMKTIQFPHAAFTQVLGVNNAGQAVGVYSIKGDAVTHGFVYQQGRYTSIDDPNGVGTTLINGVNDRGEIVGFYTDNLNQVVGFVGTPTVQLW